MRVAEGASEASEANCEVPSQGDVRRRKVVGRWWRRRILRTHLAERLMRERDIRGVWGGLGPPPGSGTNSCNDEWSDSSLLKP